jgi:hypothetical protein
MATIQDYHAREFLLGALKSRGLTLATDHVSYAFVSPPTRDAMIAWVKEYLNDDTLLTQDELRLYVLYWEPWNIQQQ